MRACVHKCSLSLHRYAYQEQPAASHIPPEYMQSHAPNFTNGSVAGVPYGNGNGMNGNAYNGVMNGGSMSGYTGNGYIGNGYNGNGYNGNGLEPYVRRRVLPPTPAGNHHMVSVFFLNTSRISRTRNTQ